MAGCKQQITYGDDVHHHQADADDFLIGGKDAQHRLCGKLQEQDDDQAGTKTHQGACLHPLLHPVMFAGTDVLTHKGGQGHGKAHGRQDHETIDLHIGAAAGNSHRAKGIDAALDHDI